MISIIQECTMCGEVNSIQADEKRYRKLINREDFVQNLFPEYNPMEREFIKTGYCPRCQKLIFGTDYTSNRIRKEKR